MLNTKKYHISHDFNRGHIKLNRCDKNNKLPFKVSDINILNSFKIHISGVFLSILEKKGNEIKNIKECTPSTLFPQLPLPDDVICTLSKISHDAYLITPLDGSSPKIPTGKVNFAILEEDPQTVLCFEQNEVYRRKELREQVQGIIKYGHSSLAYKKDGINIVLNRNLSLSERTALSTKPVLLSGTMIFPEEEEPCLDGGVLLSWSNDSGHFKPSNEHAIQNRIGYVKELLPLDKYHSYDRRC